MTGKEERIKKLEAHFGKDEEWIGFVLADGRTVPVPDGSVFSYVYENGREYDGVQIVDCCILGDDDMSDWDELSLSVYESERQVARGEYDIRDDIEMTNAMREAGIYHIDSDVLEEWKQKWKQKKKEEMPLTGKQSQ